MSEAINEEKTNSSEDSCTSLVASAMLQRSVIECNSAERPCDMLPSMPSQWREVPIGFEQFGCIFDGRFLKNRQLFPNWSEFISVLRSASEFGISGVSGQSR